MQSLLAIAKSETVPQMGGHRDQRNFSGTECNRGASAGYGNYSKPIAKSKHLTKPECFTKSKCVAEPESVPEPKPLAKRESERKSSAELQPNRYREHDNRRRRGSL